jgi:uncharacterized protein YaaN involved in tellurite resistance
MEMPKTQTVETPIMDLSVFDTKFETKVAKSSNSIIDENGNVDLERLTDEDKQKCAQLTRNIKSNDVNSITNYGSDLQGAMNKCSSDLISHVRAPKCGDMGTLITNLLAELDYIDADELEPSEFKKFMRKVPVLKMFVSSVEKVMKKYDTIEKNVIDISNKIKATSLKAQSDNNALEDMFKNNKIFVRQARQYVIAGKLKLSEYQQQLSIMRANSDKYEPYEVSDMESFINTFDRKLTDLHTLCYVAEMTIPQIRMIQQNNISICQKADTIVSTTIPLWKQQLSLAVALQSQQENIKAQRKVTETTNQLLKKNAERLYQNSVEVARENERAIIDVEVLKETTAKLIDTVNEVRKIHEEAAVNRRNAESALTELEASLSDRMRSGADSSTSSQFIAIP